MRTKKQRAQRAQREPEGFYKVCRELKALRKAKGKIEVQSWGIDAQKRLVFCGVDWLPSINHKFAYLIASNHKRWRRWYDNLPWNRKEDYPAKHDSQVHWIGLHSIDNPKNILWTETGKEVKS